MSPTTTPSGPEVSSVDSGPALDTGNATPFRSTTAGRAGVGAQLPKHRVPRCDDRFQAHLLEPAELAELARKEGLAGGDELIADAVEGTDQHVLLGHLREELARRGQGRRP